MTDPMTESTATRLIESIEKLTEAVTSSTDTHNELKPLIGEVMDDIDTLSSSMDELSGSLERTASES